jgi:hypothetical protein
MGRASKEAGSLVQLGPRLGFSGWRRDRYGDGIRPGRAARRYSSRLRNRHRHSRRRVGCPPTSHCPAGPARLNAMCSTKCASLRWSSSSSAEPALTASQSAARCSDFLCSRTQSVSLFARRPVRTAGFIGVDAEPRMRDIGAQCQDRGDRGRTARVLRLVGNSLCDVRAAARPQLRVSEAVAEDAAE